MTGNDSVTAGRDGNAPYWLATARPARSYFCREQPSPFCLQVHLFVPPTSPDGQPEWFGQQAHRGLERRKIQYTAWSLARGGEPPNRTSALASPLVVSAVMPRTAPVRAMD